MNTFMLRPNQLLLQCSDPGLPELLEKIRHRLERDALIALARAVSDRVERLLSILSAEVQHAAGVRVIKNSQRRAREFP
jgi:hypothetical protein